MSQRGEAIVLIGFSGAGKSSVGRELAMRTGWPHYDTDELVCAKLGLTINEIFAQHGEHVFRDAETDVLRNIPRERCIVACGGGTIVREENLGTLRRLGVIVHLKAEPETLWARISREQMRPLLCGANPRQTMEDLLRQREPIYREIADAVVDTTHFTPRETAELILAKWNHAS